mmetsp:Transcript_18107/g.37652  ORF Transcript_18107/g.37652 Transcript_18107/m.37652 type:complete len:273 (+) Transcript_18107:1139-1957(+)
MDIPTMFLHIARLINGARLPNGFRSINSGLGGSVASASAPIESIIIFTHRSGTAPRGRSLPVQALRKFRVTATTLTTSWNCKNFRILSYTFRPHRTALAIDWMLSSRITMSQASLAISVPAIPNAKPTSASFNAGASFVPSPVTDTTSPKFWCSRTRTSLSLGVDLASTRILSATSLFRSGDIFRKTGPSSRQSGGSFGSKMPASCAMNLAVSGLSPVTIRTVTPAPFKSLTASLVSGRMGSLIPHTARNVRFSSGATSQNSSSSIACSTSR